MATKVQIRKKMKEARASLTGNEGQKLSHDICRRIIDLDVYKNAKSIFLYASANNEADLSMLCEHALENGKAVAYPRVIGNDMNFHKIYNTSDLLKGYFGIMEPCEKNEIILPSEDTLVLVPGLAFSLEGHRIGYGKGFYDRYLSCYPKSIAMGVGYDFQIESAWDADELDIPLKGIITEKREVYL